MKDLDLSLKNVLKTKPMGYKKLKDFKPKYQQIEVLFDNNSNSMYDWQFMKGIVRYHDLIKKYGDRTVMSVHNYEDTHTTSVILSGGMK